MDRIKDALQLRLRRPLCRLRRRRCGFRSRCSSPPYWQRRQPWRPQKSPTPAFLRSAPRKPSRSFAFVRARHGELTTPYLLPLVLPVEVLVNFNPLVGRSDRQAIGRSGCRSVGRAVSLRLGTTGGIDQGVPRAWTGSGTGFDQCWAVFGQVLSRARRPPAGLDGALGGRWASNCSATKSLLPRSA